MAASKQLLKIITITICYKLLILPFTFSYYKLDEIIYSNNGAYRGNVSETLTYNNNSNNNIINFVTLHKKNTFNLIDLNRSIEIMNYHRKMMNTFKVSNFLAKQILTTLDLQNENRFNDVIQKRVGIGIEKNISLNDDDDYHYDFKQNTDFSNHKLLNDLGSTEYSEWLNRLATAQRIRNYLQNNNITQIPNQSTNDFNEGYVTGYGYLNIPSTDATPHMAVNVGDVRRNFKNTVNKAGYNFVHKVNHNQMIEHPSPQYVGVVNQLKEVSLKDVVAVAFTTLGFLSFGMIILQILMCITMNKDDINSNNALMMPMESINTDIEEIRRKRRSTEIHEKAKTITLMNDIARKILVIMATYGSKEKNELLKSCSSHAKSHDNQFIIRKIMQKLWTLF